MNIYEIEAGKLLEEAGISGKTLLTPIIARVYPNEYKNSCGHVHNVRLKWGGRPAGRVSRREGVEET